MAEAVKLYNGGVNLVDANKIDPEGSVPQVAGPAGEWPAPDVARTGTILLTGRDSRAPRRWARVYCRKLK